MSPLGSVFLRAAMKEHDLRRDQLQGHGKLPQALPAPHPWFLPEQRAWTVAWTLRQTRASPGRSKLWRRRERRHERHQGGAPDARQIHTGERGHVMQKHVELGGGCAYFFDRVQRHSCHLGYKFIVLFRHLRYELIVIFHCGHLPVILALVNLKAVKTVRGVVALGTGKFASSPAH